jgi:hypothetical protein
VIEIKDEKNGNPYRMKMEKIHRKKANTKKYELVTLTYLQKVLATNLYGKNRYINHHEITGHQTEKQFLLY